MPGTAEIVHGRFCPPLYVCNVGFGCPIVFGIDTSVCSRNWSGYVVTGINGSVKAVHGSWTVPRVTCPESGTEYASFWVGIDGYNSSTVEQIGTDTDCHNGSPTYYAWYEFYPNLSVVVDSVNVSAGDLIGVGVTYNATTARFTLSINSSGGGSNSTSRPFPVAQRSSAEWIVEVPKVCGENGCSRATLANFGTAGSGFDFTGLGGSDYATVGNRTGPISSFPDVAMTLVPSCVRGVCVGPILAQPTSLTADGTSFLVGRGGTIVLVACAPSSLIVGSATKCEVTVVGPYATLGKVVWSASGQGKFSRTGCRPLNGSCTVNFAPARAYSKGMALPLIISATYLGDGYNLPSFGGFDLSVGKKPSSTGVSCRPTLVLRGNQVRCAVTVKGYSPSGIVTWSQSGKASFLLSSASCTLARGRCTLTFTGMAAGTVIVRATYSGDANNIGSSSAVNLLIQ